MAKRACGWNRAIVGLLAAGLLLVAVETARAAEPALLGRVCFRDAKGLSEKIAKLVDKFVPGVGQQVAAGFKEMTDGPQMPGIDWTKPLSFALFGGKAFGKNEPVPVGVLTVADAEAFKKAREGAMGGPKHFDLRGNILIISDEEAAIAAITPQRLELYSTYPAAAGTTDVYATFFVARTIEEYKTDIDQALDAMEKQMEQGGMPGPMAMAGKFIKILKPMAALAGKEINRTSAMIQINDNDIEFAGRLYPVEDSELATFFGGQPAETSDLAKFLPAEVAAGAAMKLDVEKIRPLATTILQTLGPAITLTDADQAKVMDLIFASTQTGESAVGVAGDAQHQGMQTIQVAKITDAAKFRAASKAGVEWIMNSGFGALLQGMGMKMTVDYKPAAREYKGVPIDRVTITFAAPEGGEAPAGMGPMPPQVSEIAAVDTYGIAASNNEAGDLMNATIDRIQAGGGPVAPGFARAKAAAPQDSNAIVFVDFNTTLAKVMEQAAKQQPMIAMMAGGLFKTDPTEEPILAYGQFSKERLHFAARIPLQPLVNLGTRVRMMIMQHQGPPPGPGPAPKGNDL